MGTPDPRADPEIAACVDRVADGTSDACKTYVCGVSDSCRTRIGACDRDCWAPMLCLQANCPDLDAMAKQADFSCLAANCAEFAAGAAAAMGAGSCVTACDACTGSGSR